MNHDYIDLPANEFYGSWITKTTAVDYLPLGLLLIGVDVSWHLYVHSPYVVPVFICAGEAEACCVGDPGVIITSVATSEVCRKHLVKE